MGPLLFLCQVLDLFREKRSFPKIFYLYLACQNLREDFRLEGRFSLPRSERINPTMDKFLIPSRFSGVLQGTIRIGRSLLLLGHAGAGGVSAAIVVSMDQIVMVAAQVLAAVAAELCGRLTAPFLMRSEERRVGKGCRSRWSP